MINLLIKKREEKLDYIRGGSGSRCVQFTAVSVNRTTTWSQSQLVG